MEIPLSAEFYVFLFCCVPVVDKEYHVLFSTLGNFMLLLMSPESNHLRMDGSYLTAANSAPYSVS
jgi:hypothetical protein